MKIKVCVPYYHDSQLAAIQPYLEMLKGCAEHEFVIATAQGTDIGRARNWLVNDHQSQQKLQKIQGKFDYILDIDADISFTLEDIYTLLAMNKDIAGLPYLRQGDPNKQQYEVHTFNPDMPGDVANWYDKTEQGIKPVDSMGNGMRLTKTRVYERMEYPWYRKEIIGDDSKQEETAVDIGFCMGAKRAGFKIWCNFDRPVGHILRGSTKNARAMQPAPAQEALPLDVSGEVLQVIKKLIGFSENHSKAMSEIQSCYKVIDKLKGR
jgi:hypothetical protein